jgi:tRNA threonylcarbamoyl adenosine modification protein (Sua5/YciO/YrdC/YwlC family)
VSQYLNIHSDTPQMRLIKQVVDAIQSGAVAAIPTDAAYVLACQMGNKDALERIRQIRQLDENHHFTLMCRDLSDLGTYAQVNNTSYRLLKSLVPGAFTFILPATREVPKRLLHPKRKTIGLRVPEHTICQALLEELHEPLLIATLILPHEEWPLADPMDISDKLGRLLDVIVDGGSGGLESTTVIDLTGSMPEIIRQGKGVLS